MNHRDTVRELALTVNEGLEAYIAVHNHIFKEAASFGSVLKNLFGKPVPMLQLLEESEALLPFWDLIDTEIQRFRRSIAYQTLSLNERRYFDTLALYALAVRQTVVALIERQQALNERSKNPTNSGITWQVYREKERRYDEAIAAYRALGQKLNDAAPAIFDS